MPLRGAEFRVPLGVYCLPPADSSTSSAPAASFGVENGGKVHSAADDNRIVPGEQGKQVGRLVEFLDASIYPSSCAVCS
jgi:hypothetical protein